MVTRQYDDMIGAVITGLSDDKYNVPGAASAKYTITKAPLTVKAKDITITYGAEPEFGYEVEFSYKGFTDHSDTEYITFEEAWREISKRELVEEYDIIPYTDIQQNLPTEPGLTFEEYLEEEGLDEDEVKTTLHDMLYDEPSYVLQEYAENSWDWEAKVVSDVEWGGTYLFPKKYFEDVWKDFKNCRFMKTPQKSKR